MSRTERRQLIAVVEAEIAKKASQVATARVGLSRLRATLKRLQEQK